MDPPMKVGFPTVIFNTVSASQVAPSPISQLPADSLLVVFQLGVSAPDASPLLPITLSQVSARWRDIVMNTPTLWTRIGIFHNLEATTISLQKTLKRVEAFLSLSRECPLSVYINLNTWYFHEGESEDSENPFAMNVPAFCTSVADISRAIGHHSHRIKSFCLHVDEYDMTATVLGALGRVPMPLLENWTVHNKYEDQTFNDPDYLPEDDVEVNAHSILVHPDDMVDEETFYPNLQVVTLLSTPLQWTRFSPRNLVHLNIRMIQTALRPSSEALHRILLASSHSLQTLALCGALKGDCWVEICTMTKLESLELGFVLASEIIPFLKVVQAPNLKRFALCDIQRLKLCPHERREREFDGDIAELFDVVLRRLPLNQVQKLSLLHIALCPPHGYPVPTSYVDVYLQARTFACKFFCQMTGLSSLHLVAPDHVTLDALNYALPSNVERHGTTHPRVPAPRLNLLCVDNPISSVIRQFLAARLKNPKAFVPLVAFTLVMPRAWYMQVNWKCVDFSPLARQVHALVTPFQGPEIINDILRL
ncbi:hypothetical protein FPV67DRAFT_303233 [Lyophyllum atratum]|nr:hypothetical protein FPV67DRAFT_303233 [Lyophyllum atratum]